MIRSTLYTNNTICRVEMHNREREAQGDRIRGCYGYNKVTHWNAQNNVDMQRKFAMSLSMMIIVTSD
jgi:hypothetical protein